MTLPTALYSVVVALTALPCIALAQTTPDEPAPPDASAAAAPVSVKWTSDPSHDDSRHIRNCSVFPLKPGLYPMFYLERRLALMSVEGMDVMPLDLKLQVDSNPALDGGVLETPQKTVDGLIAQIRANGGNLRVMRRVLATNKIEPVVEDIPLQGAIEQFDKCKAWIASDENRRTKK
ncbi:hypothetical protein ACVWWW_001331 [Lysobacter sp. HA18]